jgi:hypothetical protein
MILLLDLDDSVSDTRWREGLIASHGWDAFHDQLCNDPINPAIVALVRALHAEGWFIIGLTGRPERYYTMSMAHLLKNRVPVNKMLMRPENDWRKSAEMKVDLVTQYILDVVPVDSILVLDDRDDICSAFSAIGIQSLQVHRRTHGQLGGVSVVTGVARGEGVDTDTVSS